MSFHSWQRIIGPGISSVFSNHVGASLSLTDLAGPDREGVNQWRVPDPVPELGVADARLRMCGVVVKTASWRESLVNFVSINWRLFELESQSSENWGELARIGEPGTGSQMTWSYFIS